MNPLRYYRFFHGMRIPHLGLLMKCATVRNYEAGEFLFKEGEPQRHFVLIKSGAVALRKQDADGTGVIKTARNGDVLGWSCLVPGSVWESSGEALEPTAATLLTAERLMAAASEDLDFGRELLRRTAQWSVEDRANKDEFVRFEAVALSGVAIRRRGQTAVPGDTLNVSPAIAERLCVRDGQWVQLTGKHGSAILPVRIEPSLRPVFPARDAFGELGRWEKDPSHIRGNESRP